MNMKESGKKDSSALLGASDGTRTREIFYELFTGEYIKKWFFIFYEKFLNFDFLV